MDGWREGGSLTFLLLMKVLSYLSSADDEL